jgi:hypothetical protein
MVSAVFCTLGLLAAGCSAAAPAPETTPPHEDPRATLSRSIDAVRGGNYSFASSWDGYRREGHLALPAGMELTFAERTGGELIAYRRIGEKWYLRLGREHGEPFNGVYWVRGDSLAPGPVKGSLGAVDALGADISWVAGILSTVDAATRDGNEITGTLDLTNAAQADLPDPFAAVCRAGAPGKAVPFSVTVDREGMATRLLVQLPAVNRQKAGNWVTSLSRWGRVKAPEVPPAELMMEL